MKVLFIEDEPVSVKGISDHCKDQDWENKVVDFDDGYKEIMVFSPDVVILDWRDGSEGMDEVAGKAIIDSIWNNGYRPVVVFSGVTDTFTLPSEYTDSGLIKVISKGDEQPVIDFLEKYKDYFSVLSAFRKQVGESLIESFAAINPIQESSDDYLGDSVVKYILAKRTVNFFNLESEDVSLPPWGMYVAPPVSKCISTCDIIKKLQNNDNDAKIGKATEYRMVLTPSCDMYVSDSRKAKVKNVICAPCGAPKMFYANGSIIHSVDGIEDEQVKSKTLTSNIRSALNQGYSGNMVALPGMVNICPDMTADVKKIELVPLDAIAVDHKHITDKSDYVRIASIDSPFSQQIVWAFMQNVCRPGVPDRDTEHWALKIQQ